MRITRKWIGLAFAAAMLVANVASADDTTLTGMVGDAMCGRTHLKDGAETCTKECVHHGSDYALIVKDKVYTLKATDKAKARLDKLAGHEAQ